MSIEYDVFVNDGAGGILTYASPVATVSALTWTSGALTAGHWKFGVRAKDTVSGIEEQNTDAVVDVVLDAGLNDITLTPQAPVGLSVAPLPGGGARVTWNYPFVGLTPLPTGFHVYIGTPTISYASPVATVLYTGNPGHKTNLSGLIDGSTYQIGVRSYFTSGATTFEETNTTTITLTADATPPDHVDNLTAT